MSKESFSAYEAGENAATTEAQAREAQASSEKKAPKFCTVCGALLKAGAKFCNQCGTPVGAQRTPAEAAAPAPAAVDDDRPRGGVGYSRVIDTPRFQAAVQKCKRSNRGCAWIFCILPFVIVTLYCLISGELDVLYGMAIGGAASAVFLLIFFLSSLKDSMQKPWEGVVVEKHEKTIRRYNKDDSSRDYYDEPHGIVVIRDDSGKKRKIDERLDATFATSYHYLKVGDRIRFHAIKGLSYPYEKYDKSKDDHVICAFCRRRVSIAENECPHCHNPILK